MYTTWIENGDEEIAIDVDYDYHPAEPRTFNYPGCEAEVFVDDEACLADDPKVLICLLMNTKEEIEEEILSQ